MNPPNHWIEAGVIDEHTSMLVYRKRNHFKRKIVFRSHHVSADELLVFGGVSLYTGQIHSFFLISQYKQKHSALPQRFHSTKIPPIQNVIYTPLKHRLGFTTPKNAQPLGLSTSEDPRTWRVKRVFFLGGGRNSTIHPTVSSGPGGTQIPNGKGIRANRAFFVVLPSSPSWIKGGLSAWRAATSDKGNTWDARNLQHEP